MKVDKNRIGWIAAAGLVVANMIGTGVFTSLGFQLASVKSSWTILVLWIIGGILALIGAFIYAELGTLFKKSGGDYVFLSTLVHPLAGYLYAWTALVVGFSAPVALAAMAMVYYLAPFIPASYGNVLAISTIILVSGFHSVSVRQSTWIHSALTIFKILFAIVLVMVGFAATQTVQNSLDFQSPWIHELLLPGFAVSLIYVSYAYTGWNAAAYIVEEVETPLKNLPRALIVGTLFVTVVYCLLQIVFLKHGSLQQLTGQVDVATISFNNLFQGSLTSWISLFISLQLISTISGYIWIGPRITAAIAKDYTRWNFVSGTNRNNVPVRSIWLNAIISILLLFSGSFEQVLLYAGIVLQLMGALTVAASLAVKKDEKAFKAPFTPGLQIVFLIFSGWTIVYTVYERPFDSLIGFAIMAVGVLLYFFDKKKESFIAPD
jgi:APA family basic amino acid/polyamine antiporter